VKAGTRRAISKPACATHRAESTACRGRSGCGAASRRLVDALAPALPALACPPLRRPTRLTSRSTLGKRSRARSTSATTVRAGVAGMQRNIEDFEGRAKTFGGYRTGSYAADRRAVQALNDGSPQREPRRAGRPKARDASPKPPVHEKKLTPHSRKPSGPCNACREALLILTSTTFSPG